MLHNTDRWYLMKTGTWVGPLYAVIHQPTGKVLGYFQDGFRAKWLMRELNNAAVSPLEPAEYDGSQWNVDPT